MTLRSTCSSRISRRVILDRLAQEISRAKRDRGTLSVGMCDIDHFKYIEREFQVLFGSHSKWGPVTLAGTFGLGTALKKEQRCFTGSDPKTTAVTSGCENSKQALIAIVPGPISNQDGVANLNGWAYPIDLLFRISLGVVF